MELALLTRDLERYKSSSQRARVATESWAGENLYCPQCASDNLTRSPSNTPAVDFVCLGCESAFQLKSQSRPFASRITDSAYEVMMRKILEDKTPNLFALHYDSDDWEVRNLFLIPRFAFSSSIVEKRKPLSAQARRAGWVGCNFLIGRIPAEARIHIVMEGLSRRPKDVRESYARLRPLQKLQVENRGWTLDVMNCLGSLRKPEFTLAEAYGFERELHIMHPQNRHARDKIRQQLQVLRDLHLIEFLGRGNYRLL